MESMSPSSPEQNPKNPERQNYAQEAGTGVAVLAAKDDSAPPETWPPEAERLPETLEGLLGVLAGIVELRFPGLRGHGERVAKLSKRLAEAGALPPEQVSTISAAARLHDLGKITLSPGLWGKAEDKLSEKEIQETRIHPLAAGKLLADIPNTASLAKLIKHHHENYDGTGYPNRLAKGEIPLGSRIIAIANLYDRLVYPPGKAMVRAQEQAGALLKEKGAGILDPELLESFITRVLPEASDIYSGEVEISADSLAKGLILTRGIVDIKGMSVAQVGTRLYPKLINNLKRGKEIDPVISRIFIDPGSLPAYQEESAASPEDGVEAKGQKDEKKWEKPVIFVVDDQMFVINALRRELRSAGYEVKGFTNPREALEKLKYEHDLYAVISDFSMPVMNGDKFLAKVQEEKPDIPCVVMTAHATKETIIALANAAQVDRIITKPWNKEELLATIKNLHA